MATVAEALASPSAAAQYLHDVNSYAYINVAEAQNCAMVVEKWSESKANSRKFYDKWKQLKGCSNMSDEKCWMQWASSIALVGDGGQDYTTAQKKVKTFGTAIYENALQYTKDEDAAIAEKEAKLKSEYEYSQATDAAIKKQQYEASVKAQAEYEASAALSQQTKQTGGLPSGAKVRTTTSVTVRSAPTIDKKNVVGTAKSGEILDVSTSNQGGEWTTVLWKGSNAYIYTKYLNNVSQTTTSTGKTKVTTTKTPAKKPASSGTSLTPSETTPPPEEGISTTSKLLIGGTALAVIGLTIYLVRKK
jgi:hypothetical protein